MRAATFESINAPQLATTTDRLLAHGRFSKRRGPHIAQRYAGPIAAEAPKRRLAPRLVMVAVLALAGSAIGIGVTHAAPAVAPRLSLGAGGWLVSEFRPLPLGSGLYARKRFVSRQPFAQPQPFAIGRVEADCPKCRARLFIIAHDSSADPLAALKCVACGTVSAYATLLDRVSSVVLARAKAVLAESRVIRNAVLDAAVDETVRSRVEEYVARSTRDSRIAIALLKGDRLEYRVVNGSYAAIRSERYLGRSYRDLFPEAAELGAEAKLREVIATRTPWSIGCFETPIPGRIGLTSWEGECVPVASNGRGVDSVLVVNWEVTDRRAARLLSPR